MPSISKKKKKAFFITFQNILILALISFYSRNTLGAIATIASSLGSLYILLNPVLVSDTLLDSLLWATVFIGVAAKFPQIYSNFSLGSTGQLSFVTTILQFVGSTARIFTTLQEVKSLGILAGFALASALNGVIVIQLFWYRGSAEKDEK
ncbi:hypothetical protein HK096_003575, partial [Nowakowskiella sp. JEL0078]